MSIVLTEDQNGVRYIKFNRPDKLNSFNKEMAQEVQRLLISSDEDKSIRCIVITGVGRAFCAGQDLEEAISEDGPELKSIVEEHYNPIIKLIRGIEKPILAMVNGVAAGAGANIALACDIVFAAKSSKFIQAFSSIGLIPDSGGTYFLPRLIGMGRASALAFLAERIKAEEAEKMGMIWKAVDDEDLEMEVHNVADHLAGLPTYGIGLTKRAFNEAWNNSLDNQLDLERDLQAMAGLSYDYQEGVNAFLEKRKPKFKGE